MKSGWVVVVIHVKSRWVVVDKFVKKVGGSNTNFTQVGGRAIYNLLNIIQKHPLLPRLAYLAMLFTVSQVGSRIINIDK